VNPYQSALSQFGYGPFALFADLWHYKKLVWRLARREIEARYRGSFFGLFWSLFTPLLTLAVYSFVFSVIFKSRWEQFADKKGAFALVLFSGLIVYGIFSECLIRAPGGILENTEYVKRVVFPLEILPCVAIASALFNAFVSTLVLLIAYLFVLGLPPWTALLFPVVLLPLLLCTLGISWFLHSLGVFIRDLRHVVGIVISMLAFVSPIFYPLTAFPVDLRTWVYLNPLTNILEQTRDVLFWGQVPNWSMWAVNMLASWVICWLGFLWFCKTRKGFADVI